MAHRVFSATELADVDLSWDGMSELAYNTM